MTGYIIRRLGQAIIVVLGVTIIAFFMEHLLLAG
jgi:ABC-type dipeptide/oligopeptide/nickel transport system permease component